MIASAGDWSVLALALVWVAAVWGLYAYWVVRHGVRTVLVEFPPSASPGALDEWVGYYSEWLASHGYVMTGQGYGTVTYWRRYFPSWSVLVAVLLFPIGLLALLARNDATLFVSAEPGEGGTRIRVSGTVHRLVAKELEADAQADGFSSTSATPWPEPTQTPSTP